MAELGEVSNSLSKLAAMVAYASPEERPALIDALRSYRQSSAAAHDKGAELATALLDALQSEDADAAIENVLATQDESAFSQFYTLEDIRGTPPPDPVLKPINPDGSSHNGVIIGRGEVGLVSGAGGVGKSVMILEDAIYGGAARLLDAQDVVTPHQLAIAPSRTLYAGYEDSLARVAERHAVMEESWRTNHTVACDNYERGVRRERRAPEAPEMIDALERAAREVIYCPVTNPLFAAEGGSFMVPRSTPAFDAMWIGAVKRGVDLIIIDPATAAYIGSANDAGPVRAFLAALSSRAAETGISIIIIAHDTKSARSESAREGMGVGAAAVSGSAQWHDAARALLWVTRPPMLPPPKGNAATEEALRKHRQCERDRTKAVRTLRLEKANYGPAGWSADIGQRALEDGRWSGWSAYAEPV